MGMGVLIPLSQKQAKLHCVIDFLHTIQAIYHIVYNFPCKYILRAGEYGCPERPSSCL